MTECAADVSYTSLKVLNIDTIPGCRADIVLDDTIHCVSYVQLFYMNIFSGAYSDVYLQQIMDHDLDAIVVFGQFQNRLSKNSLIYDQKPGIISSIYKCLNEKLDPDKGK